MRAIALGQYLYLVGYFVQVVAWTLVACAASYHYFKRPHPAILLQAIGAAGSAFCELLFAAVYVLFVVRGTSFEIAEWLWIPLALQHIIFLLFVLGFVIEKFSKARSWQSGFPIDKPAPVTQVQNSV